MLAQNEFRFPHIFFNDINWPSLDIHAIEIALCGNAVGLREKRFFRSSINDEQHIAFASKFSQIELRDEMVFPGCIGIGHGA